MANTTLNVRIKNRYDTEANWSSNNPVLLNGELAISSDKNGMYKVGNGTSTWSELPYNNANSASTATKATQDSAGQQINTTYIKGLSVSGKTVTYTKGDGTTGTITTQDTNTTYSTGTTSTAGITNGIVFTTFLNDIILTGQNRIFTIAPIIPQSLSFRKYILEKDVPGLFIV